MIKGLTKIGSWGRFFRERRYRRVFIKWLINQPVYWKNSISLRKLYRSQLSGKVVALLPDESIGPYLQSCEYFFRYCNIFNLNLTRDVVFIGRQKPVNLHVREIISRRATVISDDALHDKIYKGGYRYLNKINRYIPDNVPGDIKNGLIYHPECTGNLHFTKEDMHRGWSLLRSIGIDDTLPVVTVHNKDNRYHATVKKEKRREDRYRDTAFDQLQPAIDDLTQRKYTVVRAGYYDDTEGDGYYSIMKCSEDDRSFLDLFIQKVSSFSICGDSGIAFIPWVFRTPILYHNFIPMDESPVVEKGVVLPKLLRRKSDEMIMSLEEIRCCKRRLVYFERGKMHDKMAASDSFQNQDQYDAEGIEVVNNTREEIVNGVQEVELYVRGELTLNSSEIDDQNRFRESFPIFHPMRHHTGVISPYWLNIHRVELFQ